VRALQDIDGVDLESTHVFDEAAEPPGGQPGRARAGEVLPLEEERGDRGQRKRRAWHPDGDYQRRRVIPCRARTGCRVAVRPWSETEK